MRVGTYGDFNKEHFLHCMKLYQIISIILNHNSGTCMMKLPFNGVYI